MLFDEKEFEHFFDEPILKKGLKLVSSGKIELLNKAANGSFIFLAHKPGGEFSLQIKAGKINSYKCFCEKKNCEHLAAGIFYLQKELVEFIRPGKRSANKKQKKGTSKNTILESSISRIKNQLKPFAVLDKLKSAQINEIIKKISYEQSNASDLKQLFYFDLAIILEVPKLSVFNNTGIENKLEGIVIKSKKRTEQLFSKSSTAEKLAVIEASKHSLRSQNNFRTGTFSFLMPYACLYCKDKNDLELLKQQLKKRSQAKNRLTSIDRKLIAELQLSIAYSKLFGRVYSLKEHQNTIELPIALAELEFCRSNNSKGFKILKQYAQQLKIKNINKYLDLLDEMICFSKEKNSTSNMKEFLLGKFIYGYVINEIELDQFFTLHKDEVIDAAEALLIKRLKSESVFYTFEKLAVVLLHRGRMTDLINEIKKENNKFKLLNSIAGKVFSDDTFIKLYAKHLSQAITEARFPYFQEQVFNLARIYIDNLKPEQRRSLLKLLKEKTMYDKTMHAFILKCYPLD